MLSAARGTIALHRSSTLLGMAPELVGIVALHLGGLHPYEKILTLILAFGPFVLLGVLVVARRRHDQAEERVQSDRLSD